MIKEMELETAANYENVNWDKTPLEFRKKKFLKAREWYYNSPTGKTLMSDDAFDRLEDSIKKSDPNWVHLKKTGAKVKKSKIKLPIAMPSLNKRKPDDIQDWLDLEEADTLILTYKLDGTALQVGYDNGVPEYCYTRGDGLIGQNVTHIMPHLKIPQKIPFKGRLVVRCEGLFQKAAFAKYKDEFTSARAAASGIMNRTSDKIHPATKDLKVMVLAVLFPRTLPGKGLKYAKKLGFDVVPFKEIPAKKLTPQNLDFLLKKHKKKSKFEMDGLVLEWNKVNPVPTGEKPNYAVAFKSNISLEEAPTATIKYIEWTPSGHGRLTPVAVLEPTMFEGHTIQRATGKNAASVKKLGLGPGAKVKLLRSGDIIPEIVGVVKSVKPQMPDNSMGKWHWDGPIIYLDNPDDSEVVQVKRLLRFFKKMELDFIGPGIVQKFYEAGYDSVKKILAMEPNDIKKIEGFKDTSANKLYEQIQRVFTEGAFLPRLMAASGKFPEGMGEKRITIIQKKYPDLLGLADYSSKELIEMIAELPSFNTNTASSFVHGIYDFKKWFDKSGIKIKKPEKVKLASKKLDGIGVTWTGYRSDEQEETVKTNGGEVVSFGGSTSVLIFNPAGKVSSKPAKAKAKGIPVLTWEQFSKKYGV